MPCAAKRKKKLHHAVLAHHLSVNVYQTLNDLSKKPPNLLLIFMQALINKVPLGAHLTVFHLDVQLLQF